MSPGEEPYAPVDCSFHDRLLALATLRRPCELAYRGHGGREAVVRGRIVDVFTRGGAEYLRLEDDTSIRLDLILRLDGAPPVRSGPTLF